MRGTDSGQTPAHWAAASGHVAVLELLLAEDPHALLIEDERDMSIAAVAGRDGHPWLQSKLDGLAQEKVVCVKLIREATFHKAIGAVGPVPEQHNDKQNVQRARLPVLSSPNDDHDE